MEYSVLLLTKNEEKNIEYVIKTVEEELQKLEASYEFIVVDGHSTDETVKILENVLPSSSKIILQSGDCYAAALCEGFKACSGEYIITLDADCSHSANYIEGMLSKKNQYALVIGSRFVKGGGGCFSIRHLLSIVLNRTFSTILRVPIKDLSSGFRLYKRSELLKIIDGLNSVHFEILIEIVAKLFWIKAPICEVPIYYHKRREGTSKALIVKFGRAYLRLMSKLLKYRRDIFK